MQYLSASRRVVDRDIAELDRGTRLVARRRRRTPSRNAVNLDRSRPGVETPAAPRCAGRRHLRRWSDAPASDVLPREANLLRDTPAAQARPLAEPAETATAVEPRGPADEPAIPARRARLGHYVVLQQIGEGAMGVVLDAYDPQLDRKVAPTPTPASRPASACAARPRPWLACRTPAGAPRPVIWICQVAQHGVTCGVDVGEAVDSALWAPYEAEHSDCGGGFLVWWFQNMPAHGAGKTLADGQPMLSLWPFMFY
jgi:hypothetical protein